MGQQRNNATRRRFHWVVGLLVSLLATPAGASVYVIEVDAADAEVNGSAPVKQSVAGAVLGGTFNRSSSSVVLPFQLPQFGPGETIATANLDLTFARDGTPTFNSDLYGLGHRSTPATRSLDHYAGDRDLTDATLIRDDQFTAASPVGRTGTDDAADAVLAAYLQGQYASGAVPGDYVFLRTSPDFLSNPGSSTSGSLGYTVWTQESGPSSRAVLTVTTIPEPATAAMLPLLGLLALRRRPRRAAGRSV